PIQTKLDFGDLINHSLQLLQTRSSVLAKYQQQFRFILVDEFQDTNYAQNELVKLLAGQAQNIMVVGDDDQSIYRFRGAAVSNIMQFQEDFPQTKLVILTQNYRSSQDILDSAYQLITNNNPDRLEIKSNIDKQLQSAKDPSRVPQILHAPSLEEETELVARTILDIMGKSSEQAVLNSSGAEQIGLFESGNPDSDLPKRWSDFAILARANNHLQPFIETLRHHGIPFQLVGSRGLYTRDEIKDLIAFLRVLVDPSDGLQLFRLLGMQVFGIDPRDLLLTLKWSKFNNHTLYEALQLFDQIEGVSSASIQQLTRLHELIEAAREQSLSKNPGQLLYDFVSEIELYQHYLANETLENAIRVLNINLFFQKIKEYLAYQEDKTVVGFVEYLDLMMQAGDNPSTAEVDTRSDAVNIMTIHAAKGLEFETVFVVNLVNDRFPTRRRSDPIPLPDAFIKETLPEGDEHLQEERRLFYVAMTRAKANLFLTYADNYGGVRTKKPSLFMAEALDDKQVDLTQAQELELFSQKDLQPAVLLDLHPYLPRQFSYSQLQTFETCPLKYKYAYIYRIPTPANRSLIFGQVIHRTLKDFYDGLAKNLDSGLSALLDLYQRNWSRQGYESTEEMLEQQERG
ncbi:MAG TPA: ATP-dependent helicase, partial [Candidatus Wirthbacteria bacterium]|nr:ATP-dependent helicase [Candidatus Wirthbacteria bacterium]